LIKEGITDMLIEINRVLGNVKLGIHKGITSQEIAEGVFVIAGVSVHVFSYHERISATQGYGLRVGTGIFKMNTIGNHGITEESIDQGMGKDRIAAHFVLSQSEGISCTKGIVNVAFMGSTCGKNIFLVFAIAEIVFGYE
jgi:hypothetical protein